MFEIFKEIKSGLKESIFNKEAIMRDLPKVANKLYSKEILEIHHEFETASDKLLLEATQIINNSPKINEDKVERLSKLGFINTKEVETTKLIKKEKKLSEKQIENINYFAINYPTYKYITEDQVKTICKKYNLVCGNVVLYKGFVPEKNLKEIEKFKLKEIDIIYSTKHYMLDNYEDCTEFQFKNPSSGYSYKTSLNDLKICAPIKDMDTSNMRISKGYKLENIPDPIVLQPVKGGYLILTAWGDEASDELVVNQLNN